MEIVGALVGVVIGWVLNEWLSVRLQDRRAKRDARFQVVREVMRLRKHPSRGEVFNEIPLFFGRNAEVMQHWTELATPRTPRDHDDLETLTQESVQNEEKMVAAMVKDVGLKTVDDEVLANSISIGTYSLPSNPPPQDSN